MGDPGEIEGVGEGEGHSGPVCVCVFVYYYVQVYVLENSSDKQCIVLVGFCREIL